MSTKTLADLRTSVRALYGDLEGVTASDTEVDLFLKDGVNVVLSRCPWILVPAAAVISTLTDANGRATVSTEAIGNLYLVELRKTDGVNYRTLRPGHPADFALQEPLVAQTVDEPQEYVLDGAAITVYPLIRSTTITLRLTYATNSIGSGFPTSAGSSMSAAIPVQAEEAAIIYAVMRLHQRDDNWQAAEFLKGDFEGRVVMLTAEHNRPQRGTVLKPYQVDWYQLDAGSDAW